MRSSELLVDAFGRIDTIVLGVLDGLDADAMNWRPSGTGNSIGWLVWHLCRIQDEQIADVAGTESVWRVGEYAERFGLELSPDDTGYGHSAHQVDAVRFASTVLLQNYHDAVLARSLEFAGVLEDSDLDRVVDTRWDPPVTLGVRLVSIIDDCAQHGGQASYVRGLSETLPRRS
ncbi:hypothetical protein MB46_15730 [Arthrobacter alpinus]|uniref:mycothiol transferase n=1 Tax=Arthrobacter alpinus TaxID=656366 RepID=UPI0005C99EC4|nr:DUF664 domain-containing protein [Arthrobacter alpinus]ALV47710.1 hypothetical protein MB46_15730 [Arthrobacter alpinus]